MHDLVVLQDILILLAVALANAYLFSRLRQSPIIGYLITGLLIGPYGFLLIEAVQEVELVAEIGVILLLFTIGLEFSYQRIMRLKSLLFKAGGLQVATTALLVCLGALALGENLPTALTLGMALALSSTAIVLKLLLERGEVDTAHGRIALAILLFQDLCVILFLVGLPLLGNHQQSFSFWIFGRSLLIMGLLFGFIRYLMRPLLRGILRTRAPELFRLSILALVLGTAWATAQAGLSLALGAFFAGLALAESESSHQVMADIIPFRDVFLAVFFISVGMLVDIRLMLANWPAVLGILLLLSLVKTATGSLGGLAARYPVRMALTAGLMTFQVGEFSFILLNQAQSLQILPTETYQLVLSVIALSMMATPLLFNRAPQIASALGRFLGKKTEHATSEDQERTANLEGHVIIAGYGPTGRNVARTLREIRVPYIHIESNGEAVRQAKQAGEIILHGDATAAMVLEGAGIHRARALVLAINDPGALSRAIPAAREMNPDLFILARTRYVAEIDLLVKLGADEVITEEFSAGLEISAFLLQQMHVSEGRTLKILSRLRNEHHQRFRQRDTRTRNLTGYLSVLEDAEIEIQAVPDDSPCLDRTLAELNFRAATGCTVVGLIRQERVDYAPTPSLKLQQGDTLMLLGATEDIQRVREFLHGHPL